MENNGLRRQIAFEESPIPHVPLEVIEYVMTLPEEVRVSLGNFLLDSAVDGFDGVDETSAELWKNEIQRRIADSVAHPEKLLSSKDVFERLRKHIDQLRRTPKPAQLHGFHCIEYFKEGWAEKGCYDDKSHYWIVRPLCELNDDDQFGFFSIGGSGADGIKFCYRFDHRGLWAFYPGTKEFKFLAATLAELVDGWRSGKISV